MQVTGLTDAAEVRAGGAHTCARRAGGAVACWGTNTSGQLGHGTTTGPLAPTLVPTPVTGLDDALSIATGGRHTCAVRAGGDLLCWGAISTGRSAW